MKRLEIELDRHQASWVSSPIRSKRDVISLWMRSIKAFSIAKPLEGDLVAGSLVLEVAKMSRLFCILDGGGKLFSVSFPFSVRSDVGGMRFSTETCDDVDNKITSEILGLIENQEILAASEVWDFVEPLSGSPDGDMRAWGLLRDLMLAEDGYMRYDCDPGREDGHNHPLHHFDVFYSGSASFKLGCRQGIDLSDFRDLLDLATPCHYVSKLKEQYKRKKKGKLR